MCSLMIFNKKYNYVWFDDFQLYEGWQPILDVSDELSDIQITGFGDEEKLEVGSDFRH